MKHAIRFSDHVQSESYQTVLNSVENALSDVIRTHCLLLTEQLVAREHQKERPPMLILGLGDWGNSQRKSARPSTGSKTEKTTVEGGAQQDRDLCREMQSGIE